MEGANGTTRRWRLFLVFAIGLFSLVAFESTLERTFVISDINEVLPLQMKDATDVQEFESGKKLGHFLTTINVNLTVDVDITSIPPNFVSSLNSGVTATTIPQHKSEKAQQIVNNEEHNYDSTNKTSVENQNGDKTSMLKQSSDTVGRNVYTISNSLSTNKTEEKNTKGDSSIPIPKSKDIKPSVDNITANANDVYVTCWTYDGRRTGNLLFNYALLITTAWRYSLKPLVHPEFLLQDYFNMNVEVDVRVREWSKDWVKVTGKGWGVYDDKLEHLEDLGLTHSNFTLYGFFQSWKFFKSYEESLRKSLVFKDDIIRKAQRELQGLIPNVTFVDHPTKAKIQGGTLIALHVRRDDIVQPHFREFGYTFPEMSFFQNSVKFFADRDPHLHVVVCCEDLVWCQSNLTGLPATLYFSQNDEAIVDLAILSMSEHVIMTTGTYGWWGAWLANGTTIYYSDWPRNGSQLSKGFVREDFFMPQWIPMT